VKNIPALNTWTTDHLYDARMRMDIVRIHPETPEHVKHAAAVLMNFYGAEIDARLVAKVEGQ
jgi:hypothetical protein